MSFFFGFADELIKLSQPFLRVVPKKIGPKSPPSDLGARGAKIKGGQVVDMGAPRPYFVGEPLTVKKVIGEPITIKRP